MKCCAPVVETRQIARRSSRLESRHCQRRGRHRIGGKWFCYQHAPSWRTHYAIVARIRAL